MKSLFMTAAVVTAAIALGGCRDRRPHPVPGPQSAPAHSAPTSGVSEISWFQGTLEEAFSHRTCHERPSLFRY